MSIDETYIRIAFKQMTGQVQHNPTAHSELCARYINSYWENRGKLMKARVHADKEGHVVIVSASVNGWPVKGLK